MIVTYLLFFGTAMIVLGAAELADPRRAFSLWRSWSAHRLFFMHGVLLIVAGFPLVLYHGPLSTIVFIIGLVIVFTGPFVLIYPEKIRAMFTSLEEELGSDRIRTIMRMESFIRIAAGAILVVAYFTG
ncbi:MAG: hypothetical protein E4G96_04265 [Chrysiogenales bacterium]|nr:MAG: hypothetical protein E4G96_04265 [Chrysiogenales bacterium]